MKRRIVAFFLSVLLMIPMGAVEANAFFLETLGAVGSVASIVGTGLSFLQISGVFKDDTSTQLKKMNKTLNEIKQEMNVMNGKLDSMNSQLNEICNRLGNVEKQLSDIKNDLTDIKKKQIVSDMYQIINSRNITAGNMKASWRNFSTHYKEPMDKIVSEYQGMITSGISDWCQYPDRRDDDIIKNSSIIVAFNEEDGNLSQVFTYENDVNELDKNLKYVIIDKSLLPDSFFFNADSYQNKIIGKIKNSLIDAVNKGYEFKTKDLPEFLPENKANFDDAYAEFIANSAFNELVYRIACIEVNSKANAKFGSDVKTAFNDYITHLFAQEDGIDAFIQAEYMTHTFEHQLKGTITDFCHSIQSATAVYGLLTTDIISLSRATANRDKTIDDFFKNLDENLNKIELIGQQSYTGHDNYCYITNSIIHLGKVQFDYSAGLLQGTLTAYALEKGKLSQKVVGTEFDSSSKKINSAAALLMYKCMENATDDSFSSYLKTVGAWDYEDMQKEADNNIIMLKIGEESTFEKSDKIDFGMYNSVKKTPFEGRFDYAKALGSDGKIIDNKAVKCDYLNTQSGEVEPDSNAIGIMLVNTKSLNDPLNLCFTPLAYDFEYTSQTAFSDISATVSCGYLYQTELPSDSLGALSPLRHINTLYLSSIYSEGNLRLIIILSCVALSAVILIVVLVLVKKKKSKKNVSQKEIAGEIPQSEDQPKGTDE